jgi:thiol peroxidase
MAQEKTQITMKGEPLMLSGTAVDIGQEAPDFEVLDNELKTVTLSSFAGKTLIICSVPSLDTSVCDTETRKFNEKAAELGEGVAVLVISMDLPFAQKRWCGAAGIRNVKTLSDHRNASFGKAYGVLIEGLRLLARAICIIDRQGVIRYKQIVPEITSEPDYDDCLNAVRRLIK